MRSPFRFAVRQISGRLNADRYLVVDFEKIDILVYHKFVLLAYAERTGKMPLKHSFVLMTVYTKSALFANTCS